MQAEQLTIAFPTYMRREAIVGRLKTLFHDPHLERFPVLVIDNGSTDGTYDSVQEAFACPRLTLLRNDENIGVVRNITRIFRECRTEYILLMSDEDELLSEHLPELLSLLTEKRPLFVSPQAMIAERVYRGRKATQPVSAEDFHVASFYISGLVYHTASTCSHVDRLEAMQETCAAARIYPLGILAVELMLTGDLYWFGLPVSINRVKLRSEVADRGGNNYRHIPSRWQQYVDFLNYFAERDAASEDPLVKAKLAKMRNYMDDSLYDRILYAIQSECPGSVEAFRRGAAAREGAKSAAIVELEAKLENFRGMIQRRDERIAKLEAQLGKK